jgi:sec-independent protein translocase protein TatB
MFDLSFGEMAMIGAVALVVLGPERLPKVARTVGEWAGKAQRYVSQVKADINREMEVAELKKLQEQARGIAHEFESAVQSEVRSIESGVGSAVDATKANFEQVGGASSHGAFEDGGGWKETRFPRRYKAGPNIDELSEEITRLKRQLAMPETAGNQRRKYAPRARLNRPRIRR